MKMIILPQALSEPRYIVTGTDTDVGKTTVAAMLLKATQGRYWKPIQSGRDPKSGCTDTQTVRRLTRLPNSHFLPETYVLTQPLSPHRAAELDNVTISKAKVLRDYKKYLRQPAAHTPLFIEGAGGLMVPITRQYLMLDLFADMQAIAPAPILLVARTKLGTINHTLLSFHAIRARGLQLGGILFNGEWNADNIRTILQFFKQRTMHGEV